MTRYAAFLRGINVNGITIKMADLKAAFEGLGFASVKTVLASGNVLFETEWTDPGALKREIEARLAGTFGYEAWVVLRETGRVQTLLDAWPFERGRAGWHDYAVLASDPATLGGLLALQAQLDPALERIGPGDEALYWTVLKGHSTETPLARELSRARFKAVTTTRNLNTLAKLV